MITTLTIESSGGIASVVAKLRQLADADGSSLSEDRRVLIEVARGTAWSDVDLRVLRREAAGLRLTIALLTSDPGLRERAARARISTFRSADWAARLHWRATRPDSKMATRSPDSSTTAIPPYGDNLFGRRSPSGFRPEPIERSFVGRISSWWNALGLLVALVLLFGGLLYALAMIVPSATIVLTPAAEPIEVTVPLQAIEGATDDLSSGIVSAKVLSVQVSGEGKLATSGRSQEPNEKARGEVVFVNRTTAAVTVPSGTIVSTATGNNVRFQTTVDAPLQSGGRVNVPIEAVLPGPTGNVRAGTITSIEGPLSLSLRVANDAPTAGGNTAQVGTVTESDQEQLQAILFEELKTQAYERLNERLEAESFIPSETVEYLALSPSFTPFIGEVSPDLYLSMSVQAVGLEVNAETGDEVATERLQAAMSPATRLISDTVHFIPGAISVSEDKSSVAFSITAQATLLRGFDASEVRSAVRGMAPSEASRFLMQRFSLAKEPEIRLGPDWLPVVLPTRIPLLPWRTRVIVDWDAAAALATQGAG